VQAYSTVRQTRRNRHTAPAVPFTHLSNAQAAWWAAGNAKDRYGNPLTIKLTGSVEPYYRDKKED